MTDPLDLLAGGAGLDASQPVAGADLLADPNAPGPFARGVKSGVAGVKSSLYGMGALAARGAANVLPAAAVPIATGLEQAALENVTTQNEVAAQGAMSFEDVVADPLRAGEYFKFLLGSAVPSLAAMATGGGIGAGIGAVATRGSAAALTARALGTVAPAVRAGALAGAVAPDFALEAGSIYPEALKTGVENPALRSVAGGGVAAALDFIPLLAAEKYLKPIGKGGLGALVKGAFKGAPVGAALEGTQETGQAIVERAAAGHSLTDSAAVSDYINSFLGGAAPGTVFGAGIGARRQSAAPVAEPAPIVPDLGTSVPELGTPAPADITPPAPATPESIHADLTARHAAAAAQETEFTSLLATLTQAQQEGEAKIAALAAEAKLPPGERRVKSEILAEKKDIAAQIKEVKAKIEEVGGQLNTARSALGALAPQIEAARQALPMTGPAAVYSNPHSAQATADSLTAETGISHTVGPHPTAPERFMITPGDPAVPSLTTPEITPHAAPLGSDIIADPNAPAPTEAEHVDRAVKGVHALFREQGMPLTTTEESFATPPQTPREVALAKVEQRAPREAIPQANPAQMAAIEENAMAVIEPLAKTMAETKTKTPEGQAKVAAKMVKAMRAVVQEAAKQPSIEAAQQYVADKLPAALKGHGVVADAADMAKAVNAGVGLARTQFSKGAVVPIDRRAVDALYGERYPDVQERAMSEFRNRKPGERQTWALIPAARLIKIWNDYAKTGVVRDAKGIDAVADTVVENVLRLEFNTAVMGHTQLSAEDALYGHTSESEDVEQVANEFGDYATDPNGAWRLSDYGLDKLHGLIQQIVSAKTPEQKLMLVDMALNVVHQRSDLAAMFVEGGTSTLNKVDSGDTAESRAALTQDEFDRLPEPAQFAAVDAYNRVMRARGVALRQRLASIIGERPELKVMTFSAEPGGPIGSYTRTGPLKAAITLAFNAKEGLSVSDHEGYHFAEDWLLTSGEKRIVANALKEGKPLYTQLVARLQQYDRENQTSLTDEVTGTPAEARAYAFEFWRRGEFKAEGPLARAWQKIKRFLERITNAVNGLGFTSIEDVFVALDRGQMAEREMVAGEGGAFQSVAGGEAWYRSALTDAVATVTTKAAPAQGWKDQIKGLVAKGVVKQVEIDAVGLNEWLDLQQGKVTKEQVVAFVKEHGVQVREVVLGGDPYIAMYVQKFAERGYDAEWNGNAYEFTNAEGRRVPVGDLPDYLQEVALDLDRHGDSVEGTKFSSYQLPGGENYRELLLTLPRALPETVRQGRDGGWMVQERDGTEVFYGDTREQAMERYERGRLTADGKDFRSSHFDQPNILAHVRFNERRDADGKRVLFIEEIQSDWAQRGRKEGFKKELTQDDKDTLAYVQGEVNKIRDQIAAIDPVLAPLRDDPDLSNRAKNFARYSEHLDAATSEKLGALSVDLSAWNAQLRRVTSEQKAGHPSAPFVTKTEAWTALALKRMIRYAAENGFGSIAWTTGEQQAARYDLSKQIKEIVYQKDPENPGWFLVEVWSSDGEKVANDAYQADKLADVVGKEIVAKMEADEGVDRYDRTAEPGYENMKVLSGLDLKVGGEGMKGYYDKIVPSVANDILKKLGGGKVGEVTLPMQQGVYDKSLIDPYENTSIEPTPQPGFTLTPELANRAAFGLPLFSKAAIEKSNRMANGEMEAMQLGEQYAHLIQNANPSADLMSRAFGVVREDIVGGLGRWWTNQMSTPNYISAASAGFKNVYQAFNTYSRYRKILSEQLVRERLPGWYKASDADRKAAFDVMLKRTVEKYSTTSQELADLLNTLTPEQRKLYDQATGMIAAVLQRQFDSQKETRRRQLTSPGAYEKWLANRQEQMNSLLDTGYVPLRRYGDYSVSVYMEAPDGSRVQAGLEFFSSPSAAKAASIAYAREIERSGVALKVEMGRRSKNERDTGVSLEQFLGTLRRQGIDISQAERERLVVAMTNADSIVRTQMMRREGLAGYSTDGMRVLHEFGVNTTSEIAYARFAPVLDAALDGAEVTADVNSVTSEPIIEIGEAFGRREDGVENNLWKRDGPMSGFYKDRANAMADTTLAPDRHSEWATKLRTAGVMYFIGGSLSGAAVNTLSIPMVLVPRLSLHTDYLNASMTSLKAWKDAWQHYNVLRDMDKMKNPDAETAARLDAAGITKEMRASIVAAADHIFDTEIHMMLGISQGSLYSKSRNIQRAAEAWMAPFRVAEQTNRLASFIAAYKVATTGEGVKQADGTFKRLSGQDLFRFASEVVDATQNNYNVNNRPGIMNNPVGALMFQFKSFPLFIIEAAALMYKVSPKSAVYMLLGLVAMSGVQGLPFAEEILNLVDVISQRLFNSPFNSRRAMRNVIKSASDAIGAVDLSDAVMRGVVNEVTGVNVATRVSSGLLPGTRLGAADADQGRVLSDIAGAPYSMVRDTLANIGGLVGGVATGDWQKAADALRAGGPIAVRNAIKGAEQLSQGYATDSKGRKLADVTTLDGLLQLTGLSSATVAKMNDLNSIIIQTKAFHTQVSQDMQNQLVKAYRDGDQERIRHILDLRAKWNEQNPTMPIMPNAAATRRAIIMAGVPLDRREQMLLGRRMAGAFSDVTGQMAE